MIAVCYTFENILNALGPYVASAFHLHSYAAATGIVASVIGGISPIPTSKLLRKCGRAQGLATMVSILVVGLIMLAACQNIRTFAAAQVFTSVGSAGITYCISVFVADTTSLRNRGLLMSFSTSPEIICMWIGGPIASSLLTGIGWRWGFGIFAFALPAAMAPFVLLLFWNERKAIRTGLVAKKDLDSTPEIDESAFRILKRFVIEVDLLGLLILATGLSLFLLPFTLYSFQPKGFDSPLIASFIAVGLALIIFYGLYERYLAPTTSIPFRILADRTVLLALLTIFLTITSFANVVGYMTSYLQVVTGLTITQTSYLISSIRVAICVETLFIGALIRWNGRLKLLNLTLGVPPMMIASGIWIHFRHSELNNLGVMIGVVVLISFSLGTTSLCGSLIMMTALGQEHNTTILAVFTFMTQIAPAIGEAVNTGIWTGTFKQALHVHLPSLTPEQVAGIYSSLDVQLSFAKGSAVREGIARSYGDAKFYMLVTSICLMGIAMIATAFWSDLRTKEIKDVRVVEDGRRANVNPTG